VAKATVKHGVLLYKGRVVETLCRREMTGRDVTRDDSRVTCRQCKAAMPKLRFGKKVRRKPMKRRAKKGADK